MISYFWCFVHLPLSFLPGRRRRCWSWCLWGWCWQRVVLLDVMWIRDKEQIFIALLPLSPSISIFSEWMNGKGRKMRKVDTFFPTFPFLFTWTRIATVTFFLVWWLDWLSFSIKSSQEATYNIDIFTINLLLTFSIYFNLKKRIRPVELIIRQIFLFFI